MAIYKADILDIELNTGNIARSFLCHNIGKDDTKADRFGVRVYRDGEPESLSGCSIQGYMMRPNGTNLAITGSNTGVSGNEAWVDLPQAAYDYEGQFCLALKLIGGGVTGTIRIIDGMINNTFVSDAVAPTAAVPTYQEILSVYDQMVAAKAGSVRFDTDQTLTAAQKTKARDNIEAASESEVSDLKSAIDHIAVKGYKPITKDWAGFAGNYDTDPTQDSGHRNGYTASNGGWTSNSIHTTYYYKAVDDFDLYFLNYEDTYVCVSLFNGAISSTNFVKYTRIVNGVPGYAPTTGDAIPFPQNIATALHITSGQTVAISVHTNNSSGFVLQTNSIAINGSGVYALANDLQLSEGQFEQIQSTLIDGVEAATAQEYADLTYPVNAGQLCWYNGKLYIANQDISVSEAWTPEHWDAGTVADRLSQAQEDIDTVQDTVDNIVSNTTETITEHTSADGFTAMDGYVIGSDGVPATNANYITFYKAFDRNANVWFTADDKTHYSSFLAISTKTGDTYTARKRYIAGSEDTLPPSGSPLAIAAGTELYISCYKTAYTTYGYPTYYWSYTAETETLNQNLLLADAHIEQVETALGIKNCKVQYKSDLSSESATEGLYIYVPTTSGYIRQQFVHSIDNTKNANCWRMGHVYACDNDLVTGTQLTTDGEWECAVRLADRSDFSGGIAHGDEVTTDILVFIDGQCVDANALTSLTEFNELRIVTYSNLYDPGKSTTVIATHGCERIYTRDGITVNQTLIWAKAVTATICYLAMFPVAKAVTDHYFTDMHYAPEAIPVDHSQRTAVNARKATVFSESAGFTGEFNTPVYPTGYANGDYFLMLDNGGNAYNKCYYCITNSSGSVTYEIASGTVWKSKTEYKMDVVN